MTVGSRVRAPTSKGAVVAVLPHNRILVTCNHHQTALPLHLRASSLDDLRATEALPRALDAELLGRTKLFRTYTSRVLSFRRGPFLCTSTSPGGRALYHMDDQGKLRVMAAFIVTRGDPVMYLQHSSSLNTKLERAHLRST